MTAHTLQQIIVDVSGLRTGEKQRVNKALAKITGFKKSTSNLVKANWMYAPSLYTDDVITHSTGNKSNKNKKPTHTPQQVLEMAGMATNRKMRTDFDPTKEYSVDVSNCTEEEKKGSPASFL